jgi:proteasome lid subunit RPN8/RPN11
MNALVLAPALQAQIGAAAAEAFPRECCGLLEGYRRGADVVVERVWPARNIAEASDRFEIDPADHVLALRTARERGRALVGCYHSHPNGAPGPSERDCAGAGEEGFVWLIVSIGAAGVAPVIGGFEFSGGTFTPLCVRPGGGMAPKSKALAPAAAPTL